MAPPATCQGCESALKDSFQCPLCQAEGKTDAGFFCSQGCFASNWLAHRDEFHKKTVREKKPVPVSEPGQQREDRRRPKRARATDDEEERAGKAKEDGVVSGVFFPAWGVMPSLPASSTPTAPALTRDTPRAVIAGQPGGVERSFWPAAVAATHVVRAVLAEDRDTHALVVAGSPYAAHAFAWAARCAAVPAPLRLVVSAHDVDDLTEPSKHFGPRRRVVIATEEAVRASAALIGSDSGAASLWLSTSTAPLLVTLPGVGDPEDLQAIGTRAFFFSARTAAELEAEGEAATHTVTTAVTHPLLDGGGEPLALREPARLQIGERNTSGARRLSTRMCSGASTDLANGSVADAARLLVGAYTESPGHFEEVLLNTMACDRAALSTAHAHHRIAVLLRYLVDHSDRFELRKGSSLAELAVRAAASAASLLPPLVPAAPAAAPVADDSSPAKKRRRKKEREEGEEATAAVAAPVVLEVPLAAQREKGDTIAAPAADEAKRLSNFYSAVPNIQLQATLCHVFPYGTAGTLDTLAQAWGISRCVAGPSALTATRERQLIVGRLKTRYQARPVLTSAAFLVTLMHFLYDMVGPYSLTLEEVERRTLWQLTLAADVDPLEKFLSNCGLRPDATGEEAAEDDDAKGVKALSSRQTKVPRTSRTELLRTLPVRAATEAAYVPLAWVSVPMSGQRQRDVARLHTLALEELLMAMPREPRPMHIGDVGNLIGRWFRFNARYDGVLGVSLAEFLRQHPEAFTVAGQLVTRRRAGTTEPVRIRFDNDDDNHDDNDSDDEDGVKKRDRALLTGRKGKGGTKIELPARARKKQARKEFNKSRHNRNYKSVDPSARVPGYVKHAPRRIKGRGKKANKRNVKRSN